MECHPLQPDSGLADTTDGIGWRRMKLVQSHCEAAAPEVFEVGLQASKYNKSHVV